MIAIKPNLLYPENYKKSQNNADYPKDFINNLALESLAAAISPHHIEFTLKLLSEVNTDTDVIKYRQDVLDDFINIPQLEKVLYDNIRTICNNSKHLNKTTGVTQSFFELNGNIGAVTSYIECMEACHKFYSKYVSSIKSRGITVLMRNIEECYNSDSFAKIKSETGLLKANLENGIKSVSVGINFDGMMRPVEAAVLSVSNRHFREKGVFDKLLYSKNPENTAVSAVYRSNFRDGGEMEINKALFEEIKKLTFDFTKHLNRAMQAYYTDNVSFILDILPQLEFYVGVKNMIERFEFRGLKMCRPEIADMKDKAFITKGMFDIAYAHKCILKKEKPPVTNDCRFDAEESILIITGPNNGGKTTYIRAIGICQIMAQTGLYVPAENALISPVDYIYTHFPREEEIGINTSRFTEECRQFSVTLKTATPYSMLLLNESISSTTPSECLAIAEDLIRTFGYIGLRCAYTTHLTELADKTEETGGGKIVSLRAGLNEKGGRTFVISKGKPFKSSHAESLFREFGIGFEEYRKKHNARSEKHLN